MKMSKANKALMLEFLERSAAVSADQKCVACNGSGHYDTKGSPPCSACNGTGLKDDKK